MRMASGEKRRDALLSDCYDVSAMHAPLQPPIPLETLMLAYRNGIFPMSDGRKAEEVFWVEPRERGILPLDNFRCSRSLKKMIRTSPISVTCNQDFDAVIEACAAPRPGHPESWINQPIIDSYRALHRLGYAHSLECWDGEELVGGLYGVGFESVFCGESMFNSRPNISKLALAWLVAIMRHAGYRLLDCQFITDHLASLGAQAISQAEYLQQLYLATKQPAPSLPNAFDALIEAAATQEVSPAKFIAQSFTHTS
ncbi:leucyl/phenylalanyl-tRNA--protein transferase [Altererythrobacter sp. MF3-039]|uniref:leucyl/phenylalanyl-tRNA--protein transferase n=1 Tax=Altererythrobacter sp. MF3-039 TaxID=3252901 RepID=UPI00390CB268